MAKAVRANSHIAKLFMSLTGSRNLWQVWSDVIFMIATAISNDFDNGERKERREQAYMDRIKNYSEGELKVIVDIFVAITEGLNNNPDQDLLGQLFMELNLGNERNGQFFTPYSVCQAMAMITAEKDIQDKINEKGYVIVNDCACGGGATLIAYANRLHEMGINYQTDCMFVAQDIDYTTALMCYIQLSMLGCPGYIKIGDSISDPATNSWTEIEIGNSIWLTPMLYRDIWVERRISEQWKGICKKISASAPKVSKETEPVTEQKEEKATVKTMKTPTDETAAPIELKVPEQISLF